MSASSVAGQDPLEPVIQQSLHRLRLFRPRVPGDVAKCDQPVATVRPCQVIAREEELVPEQKHDMPSRVTRYGNRQKVFVELDRVLAFQHLLCRNASAVGAMDQARAVEVIMKPLMIGNVVTMREEN